MTKPTVDKSKYRNETSPLSDEHENGPTVNRRKIEEPGRKNATAPADDESDQSDPTPTKSKSEEPRNNHTSHEYVSPTDTPKDSNGTKPKDSGDGHVSAEDLDGDDFFDFKWMNLNITIPFLGELTSAPTMEPTQIHACDPLNPPCARYEVGVCVEYQVPLKNIITYIIFEVTFK